MGRKLGAVPLLGREVGPYLTHGDLHAMFHLDSSNRLAVIQWQRTDGIGRTVL